MQVIGSQKGPHSTSEVTTVTASLLSPSLQSTDKLGERCALAHVSREGKLTQSLDGTISSRTLPLTLVNALG